MLAPLPLSTRLAQLGQKALLTLADQGLFSGASFVANVLLARWLLPEDYGAFALAFSMFLFLGALHTSFLTEPMLVLGAGRFRDQFRPYLSFLLAAHTIITLAGSLLLMLAAWLFSLSGSPAVSKALLGMALAAVFILLPWMLRRAFYVQLQPGWAALGSGFYFAGLVGGLLALRSSGLLSPMSAFLLMGLCSLLVSLALIIVLKPAPINAAAARKTAREQWTYARWSGISGVLVWIPLNLFYIVIPYAAGLEGAAALRALSNLLTPLTQSIQAIIVLFLPQLSRLYTDKGKAPLISRIRSLLLAFAAVSGVYWLVLTIFRFGLIRLLYEDRYLELATLLPIAGLVPIIMGVCSVLGSGLRAMERPKQVLLAYLLAAGFAVSGGVLLTLYLELRGAILGQGLSYLVMAVLLGRQTKAESKSEDHLRP